MKAQTYRIFALSQALSPITHMSGTQGNEAVLMREAIVSPDGIRWIPNLTGNTLRHAIREAGGKFLIDQLGLVGATDKRMLNFILHGGDRTEKGSFEALGGQARMYELFPFFKILAGSLPVQILKSLSKVWQGRLVCEETRELIDKELPKGWKLPSDALFPAEHFIGRYQIVRGDVEQSAREMLSQTEVITGGDNRMIAAGQTVISGSYFTHGYHLDHAFPRDLGCLLHSLSLWQYNGGRIGGKAASGHGKLKTQVYIESEPDIAESVKAYLDHLVANIAPCREWLLEAFSAAPRPEKAKKPAKGKTRGVKDVEVLEPENESLWTE